MRRLRSEQGGWALVASLLLLSCMLGTGLALASVVDSQTAESGRERQRETAFNLAEAAMTAQVFSLARDWPGLGAAATPYPSCTEASTSDRCPSAAQMRAHSASGDAAGATWSTRVRDNGPAGSESFYSEEDADGQPGYDANADGMVWVRSEATAAGRRRAMVALVRAEQQDEEIVRAALVAGKLRISNNGNKTIIDASAGGSAQSGLVAVRCTPALAELTPCAGHAVGQGNVRNLSDLTGLLSAQIKPNVLTWAYGGGAAMRPDALARLKARAVAEGTYHTSCPPASGLSGAMVYIEAGDCSYTSNTDFNSASRPGVLVMAGGSLTLNGTATYHGVVHHANLSGSSAELVRVHGNAQIVGGVIIDGAGGFVAGSSKNNVQLDLNAYNGVTSLGSAGVVQNTWRELR